MIVGNPIIMILKAILNWFRLRRNYIANHLVIKDKQYDVVSGQVQTYSVDGDVSLEFLNMEDITNFAGTIKFSNVL